MRVAILLPRNMHFGPGRATAIDLCVRDFVAHSAFRDTTSILAEAVDAPFAGFDVRTVPRAPGLSHTASAARFLPLIRACAPDLLVVQQHTPIADALARRLPALPVLLHRHNFAKPARGPLAGLQRRRYRRFARTVWVSEALAGAFRADFPADAGGARVVHNGLDMQDWQPQANREPELLCVGRAAPEKGILEAALGAHALLERPGWRARFILSRLDANAAYLDAVRHALAPLGARAELLLDQPHTVVKAAFERAALAIVPSRFDEPFGRTALEAMAGGAALISAVRGGLPEVCGDAALRVEPVSPDTLADAVLRLTQDDTLRARLAREGRARAQALFDIRALSGQLDGVYREAVGHAGA